MPIKILLSILQLEENDIKNWILDFFADHPVIASILIALVITVYFILRYLPKFKDFIESYEFFKKRIKKVNTEEDPGNTDIEFSEDNLMTVENPSGFYVENEDNVNGLLEEIRKKDERVICVVGPAGVGKTKLVQYVCTKKLKKEFELQVYVDFESVNSPVKEELGKSTDDILVEAKNIFNRALGIEEDRDTFHKISRYFQKPTIFFIDNYEQIIDNPSLDRRIQSEIIKTLIDHNPLIKIIITSRESIGGTNVFEVKALSNISVEKAKTFKGDLLSFKAIHLFCKIRNNDERKHRRTKSKPYKPKPFSPKEFLAIVELCNLVSNLPLGIRLIASRSVETDVFTIKKEIKYILNQDIQADFGELADRHTNLYNVFNWSFKSLTEDEKEFYRHLTHFQNGFFKNDIPTWPNFNSSIKTKDTINKLYRKSFLREQEYPGASNLRYEVYTLFKQLLNLQKESNALDQAYLNEIYKSYLAKLLKMQNIISGSKVENLEYDKIKTDLRLDIENIESFIEHVQHNDIDIAIDLLVNLEKVLNEVGPYIVLEKLYDPLLEKVKDSTQKARLLMSKARVLKSTKRRHECVKYIKEAIAILEKQGEVTSFLGDAYRIGTYLSSQISQYDFGESIIHKFELLSDDEKQKLGELNCAFIIQERAKMHERNVNFNLAEASFDESLRLLEDYKVQQAQVLNYSGLFYWRMGHSEKSERQLTQAISQYKGIGEERWILGFKTNLGLLYCDQDKLDAAMKETNEAYEILRHQGPYGWSLVNLQNKGRIVSRYEKSASNFKEAETLLLDSTDKLNEVGYNESETLGYAELAELYYKYDKLNEAYTNAKKGLELAKTSKIDKWMRTFRMWCVIGLIAYKNANINESLDCLNEAERILLAVNNNQWLTYKVTRMRYDELKKLHTSELISYPWDSFLKEKESFNLFGYGSLINQYSSKETINNSDKLIPVLSYGVKRYLNYDPDDNVRSRPLYQDPNRGEDYFGAFNLEYTGKISDKANGVIRRIEKADFEKFVNREVGYSLVKIKCQDFGVKDSPFIEAYTLVAPKEYNGRKLVNNDLLPNVPYYKICREGAAAISDEFLQVWLDTSFLGDGRNVRLWEKEEGLNFNE
ncbi:AAA family ATPase [Winogradskyella sp.]|uniref:tetratricopeptide repeat protein n=1 Tax=Winogradskyella sp. TaxID=1883156 RepID=UPI001B046E05|nr:AAA family ATPase [Winogradskyella sp.]MBO6880903.1 AAA family ATPase [Winogradskyella sp.]